MASASIRGRDRAEHEDARVARVPEVPRGRVGDEGALVVAREVVAHLHLPVHAAHHGEAHAVDADRLPHRRAPREELLPELGAQECHPAALDVVLGAQPAAVARHLVADLAVDGLDAPHGGIRHAVAVLDLQPAHGLHADGLDQRGLALDRVAVDLLEADPSPRPLSSGLLARLARPGHHRAPAEGIEGVDEDPPEARAVGQQNRHRHDAPDDAEHGEEAAGAVAGQVRPALDDELTEHGYPPASQRRASMGSIEAARRAG